MTIEFDVPADAATVIAVARAQLEMTQAQVADAAGVDQSRISRVEKGDVSAPIEIKRIIDVLAKKGSSDAKAYSAFMKRKWVHIERPLFRNPQIEALTVADDALVEIDEFLNAKRKKELPWPLTRQLERQAEALRSSAHYLINTSHQVAFVGDLGVGKSTAISVLFDLLVAAEANRPKLDRVVLETGGGRTTICEVHVRRGPQYGIHVQPQTDSEFRSLVSDFCANIWVKLNQKSDAEAAVGVSEEISRAIRNMAGVSFKREKKPDGTRQTRDRAMELATACGSEDVFRARVLEQMNLSERTKTEWWFDSAPGLAPLEWMASKFKQINNGLLSEAPLPRRIVLLVPDLGKEVAPLDLSIVDTKGIDDIAIRPDIDSRLTDSRSVVVLCSKFNDAPGTTAQILMQHLRQNLAEKVEGGRVLMLVLPRPGEALRVKDDAGSLPEDTAEGYEMKREQVERAFDQTGLGRLPVAFFDASSDNPVQARNSILAKLAAIRHAQAERIESVIHTAQFLIKNHKQQAVAAAIEEVARQLRNFMTRGDGIAQADRGPSDEVMTQIGRIRYASTLWASTRRSGDYNGFDVYHHLGVGAATNALTRTQQWFSDLEGLVRHLKSDNGLALASRVLDQIESNIQEWRTSFAESVRNAGSEVYREPLGQSQETWNKCVSEWGRGPGFKRRVAGHLQSWFQDQQEIDRHLELLIETRFRELVISELEKICNEGGTATGEQPVADGSSQDRAVGQN